MSKDVFDTGATRNSDGNNERYDLIPPIVSKREAKVWAEGAASHGEGNWKLGLPTESTIQHLLWHLNEWRMGNRDEDHLAKVRWGAAVLMYFEEYGNGSPDKDEKTESYIRDKIDKWEKSTFPTNNANYREYINEADTKHLKYGSNNIKEILKDGTVV
jgi:hypothetical protein